MNRASLDAYPRRVADALGRLLDGLAPLSPEPSALVVYGSLAKGTYREGESDVNLAVVLRLATPELLRALAEPLQAAHRAVRVVPFVVEAGEIPRLVDAFPVKIADIIAARHVLMGEDPFAGLVVDREHLRLRTEQELRNHLLRLRRRAIFAGDEPRALAKVLYESASSLAIELGALLAVSGRSAPTSMRAVMRAAAEAFALDGALLERLCDIKEGGSIADARATFDGLLGVLGLAVEVVDRAGGDA